MLGDADQLRARGHDIVLGIDTVRPGNLREIASGCGYPVAPLMLSRKVRATDVVRDVRALHRMASGLDVVHTHFAHDHLVAMLGLRAARGPVRLVRAVETTEQFAPTAARRWTYRATDGFEVATQERSSWLQERFGVAADRIAVLPGAVDATRFSPADAGTGASLRTTLGVASQTPLVGMVARLKAEREQDALIEAFAAVHRRLPGARLAFLGRGEHEPELREKARLLAGRAVLFAGYWSGPDLVEAYRGLDVAVWLREGNDGSSRGVLEAMAVGLPVIAARRDAMAELIEDGRTGLLVPPGDSPALGAALERLLADPDLRRELGANARAQVLAHHSWERRGVLLAQFYERLLGMPSVG
jgi:glycosyltransferase involved in cell wall biosynthesis